MDLVPQFQPALGKSEPWSQLLPQAQHHPGKQSEDPWEMGLFGCPAFQVWRLAWRPWAEVTPILQAVGKAHSVSSSQRTTEGS